jgi:hypothetical protein
MSKDLNTFAKRARENQKKQKATDKRVRREQRRRQAPDANDPAPDGRVAGEA